MNIKWSNLSSGGWGLGGGGRGFYRSRKRLLVCFERFPSWLCSQPRRLFKSSSTAIRRGIDSRNRVWNWVAKLHRLAGRCENPMSTWFVAPIAGFKLPTQRPYLDIFKAPGSPCHELTSSDNSTSMRICLGRKESECEGILPVSLHRWHCQQHHYLSSSSNSHRDTLWNVKLKKTYEVFYCSLYMVFDILKVLNQTPPPTLSGTWQGLNKEKKRSIPLSLQNLSMSWV